MTACRGKANMRWAHAWHIVCGSTHLALSTSPVVALSSTRVLIVACASWSIGCDGVGRSLKEDGEDSRMETTLDHRQKASATSPLHPLCPEGADLEEESGEEDGDTQRRTGDSARKARRGRGSVGRRGAGGRGGRGGSGGPRRERIPEPRPMALQRAVSMHMMCCGVEGPRHARHSPEHPGARVWAAPACSGAARSPNHQGTCPWPGPLVPALAPSSASPGADARLPAALRQPPSEAPPERAPTLCAATALPPRPPVTDGQSARRPTSAHHDQRPPLADLAAALAQLAAAPPSPRRPGAEQGLGARSRLARCRPRRRTPRAVGRSPCVGRASSQTHPQLARHALLLFIFLRFSHSRLRRLVGSCLPFCALQCWRSPSVASSKRRR